VTPGTPGPDWPRIAIVTVLYRCEKFVRPLLESVATVDYPREVLSLHLVDNSPGDGTLAAARAVHAERQATLPPTVFHQPLDNLGFAKGNNLAIAAALEAGADFVFLLNPDATFEPSALKAAVETARAFPNAGSVQSLLVLGDAPDTVNTHGNAIHFLGFGYVAGYKTPRAAVSPAPRPIAFSSGACVLLSARVLRAVGLFDETLWLYHEDLDLGWRIRLAGFDNLVAPRSVCRHHYEFSRATSKWYWMERNRWIVVLKNYRLPTILLLLPVLLVTDLGLLAMALKGGWWKSKLKALAWFLRPSAWGYLWRGRRDIARLRTVSDRQILGLYTAVIDHPDFKNPVVRLGIEPVWKALLAILRVVVRW
jgi:GT2 family glycosyltransferase